MKFFFLKTDSIYKILKVLEKVSPHKQVQIFIDPEHAFFENLWRGKQLKEIIVKRNLNIIFQAEQEPIRRYFQQLELPIQEKKERPIVKIIKTFGLFLFDIKRFHLFAENKQQYLTYLIFGLEILAGAGLIWFLGVLFVPSATIHIKAAQNVENIIYNFRYYPAGQAGFDKNIKQLSIPFSTGMLHYQYQLTISTDNIQHLSNPSEGTVKIYNRTPNDYNLLANTRFIATNGAVFLSKETIHIPAGSQNKASETKAKLIAAEYDEAGKLIGVRGNILRDSKLSIKNIKDSHLLNHIWAEAIDNFKGGETKSLGIVSEKDHQILTQKLTEGIYKEKLNIVKNNFQLKNSLLLLNDPLVKTTIENISIDGKIGDKLTSLQGKAQVSFRFMYLKRDDIIKAFNQYVRERQSDSIQLINIDPNSLNIIYENLKKENLPGQSSDPFHQILIIPTKVSIFQGYDFKRDTKGILTSIKNNIAGKTVNEALKIIQSYPEISSSSINLGLLGGTSIPNIKSRISLKIDY